MIPELGENVKDVSEHALRKNSVGYAQTIGNKRVCYLQPRWCADHLCRTLKGEQMMTDELGISCSIGSHQGEKENSLCMYHWARIVANP